jgi:hypothetical protein
MRIIAHLAASMWPPLRADVPEIPIDFVLFAVPLLGVALFHHHTVRVAVGGLAVIALYKVIAARSAKERVWPGWVPTSCTNGW